MTAEFRLLDWLTPIFELNEKWWTDIRTGLPLDRDEGELFMLMSSEVSEALEGERKNLDDTKLPQFKMAGVEMADLCIRGIDYCTRRDLDVQDWYNDIEMYLDGHEKEDKIWIDAMLAIREDDGAVVNRGALLWNLNKRLVDIERVVVNQSEGFAMLFALARVYCDLFDYPFEEAFVAKYEYNLGRADHKHENRIQDGGVKF